MSLRIIVLGTGGVGKSALVSQVNYFVLPGERSHDDHCDLTSHDYYFSFAADVYNKFVQGAFVEDYDPTIEDLHSKHVEINGEAMRLEILARQLFAEHFFRSERAALHSYGPDPHSC